MHYYTSTLCLLCIDYVLVRISLDTIQLTCCSFAVRILLPIFCILVILACVGMSVFAHYWYPYIDHQGNKRSKTKPAEYALTGGCHGNALTVLITGRNNQQCGGHAQLSALDNLYKYYFVYLYHLYITTYCSLFILLLKGDLT